jgi:chaperonin GroES
MKKKKPAKKKVGVKRKEKSRETATTFSIMPLHDRVVVRPVGKEEVMSASGIIIPDTVDKEKPERGTVIAVGPGKYDEDVLLPMTVKIGDTVLFSKYGYDEVKVAGEDYFIISESNILAVVKQ